MIQGGKRHAAPSRRDRNQIGHAIIFLDHHKLSGIAPKR
jgi:hypothetical protein